MKKCRKSIPTLAGLLVIIGGLVVGLSLVRLRSEYITKAMESTEPREVKISNIEAASITISWVTDKAAAGWVKYGESESTMNMTVSDIRDQQSGNSGIFRTHYVTVGGLKPATMYKLLLGSGNNIYNLNGEPYTVSTGPLIDQSPEADVAYGQVVTGGGDPAEGAVVYLQLPGAGLMSELVKNSGSWVIPIAKSRTSDLTKYVKYDPEKETVRIWVQDGELGMAEVATLTSLDSPVPNIELGSIYDFTKTAAGGNTEAVKSKIVTEKLTIPTGQFLLLTPMAEEQVQTNTPMVIGEAPPGTKITIVINSEEEISATISANDDGRYSYQVPTTLGAGTHTIIVTSIIGGVKKSITRSFVVSAAEDSGSPYYSATPSATLKPYPSITPTSIPVATVGPTSKPIPTTNPSPTIKPTSTPRPTNTPIPTTTPKLTDTPKPTSSPRPTNTPKPTITPRPTSSVPTPTPAIPVVPQTGAIELTLLMLVLGLGMMVTGGWWYRRLE